MNKTVIFYGHLPKKGEVPIGGGEVGNSRTLRMLSGAGYNLKVVRMPKPSLKWGAKMIHAMYPFRVLSVLIKFLFTLLFSSRKSIVHISGFAGVNVWSEAALMKISKSLGFFTIYEQRAGGAIQYYETGTARYRKCYANILRSADYIFTQGVENIPMMRTMTDRPIYHYPNCVEDSFAPATIPQKDKNVINLLYFGRIEEEKHVDLVIEAASIVQNKYTSTYLTVIGGGFTKEINKIKALMAEKLLPNSYSYIAGLPHDDLAPKLADSHFYIFPSTQPLEGQSNSVTEAMSFGIIPIASPQGFNRSTIGNDYLIVGDLTAVNYANKIIEIMENDKSTELSRQIFERFRNNFIQSIVFKNTIAVYNDIFSSL